jgi:hypothetical protein
VLFQQPKLQPRLMLSSPAAVRVLIEPIDLRFEMPPVEPLYCSVQIWNIKEKRRLSGARTSKGETANVFLTCVVVCVEIGYMYNEYNPTLIDLANRQTSAAAETQVSCEVSCVWCARVCACIVYVTQTHTHTHTGSKNDRDH